MDRNLRLQVLLSAVDKITAPLKRITEGSKGLSGSLQKSRDALKQLDKTASDLRGFRQTNIDIRKNNRELVSVGQRHTELTAHIEKQNAAHVNLRANLQTARSRYNQLSLALQNGKGTSAEFLREYEKVKISVTAAKQAFDRSSEAKKIMKDRLRNVTEESKKLTQQKSILQERLGAIQGRLGQAGVGMNNMRESARSLRTQQSQLTQTIDQQKAALERLNAANARYARNQERFKKLHSKGMSAMGHGVGMGYGAATAGNRLFNFIRPGMEFDTTYSKVQALTRLDKDDDQLKMLRNHARELGAKTLFTSTQVAEGQAFLAMAGFEANRIRDAMPGLLDMAKAGDMDLGTTADIGSNILTAMNLDASKMDLVADVITGAFTRSNTSIATIGETMKYAAPGAARFGVDLEMVAAMAAKLGDAGIQGSMAGTGIRRVISRLTAPNKAARDALEKLGVTVSNADGKMRPMEELLGDLYQRSKDLGDIERGTLWKDIAGETGAGALGILVDQSGTGDLGKLLKELRENTKGEANRTATTMANNLTGDLDQLTSAWADVRLQIFDDNNSDMRSFIGELTEKIRALGDWVRKNPEQVTKYLKWAAAIIAVVGALSVVLVPLGILMMMVGSIVTPLLRTIQLIGMLNRAWVAMGVASAIGLGPLLLIIGLIAVAAFLIWKNWDWLKAKFDSWWEGMKAAWNAGGLELVGYVASTLAAIGKAIIDWSPIGLFYTYLINPLLKLFGAELPEKLSGFGAMAVKNFLAPFRTLWSALVRYLPTRLVTELGLNTTTDLGEKTPLKAGVDFPLSTTPLVMRNATAPVTNESIQFNITAAAGTDERALAMQIQRIMDDRDRQKQARTRGLLYDN